MLDGVWRIAVTLPEDALQYAYYRLDCLPGGALDVNLGEIPQWQAEDDPFDYLGWTATRVTFTDGCEVLDTVLWCVYYELEVSADHTLTGSTIVVGEDGTEFRFPTIGHYIGP